MPRICLGGVPEDVGSMKRFPHPPCIDWARRLGLQNQARLQESGNQGNYYAKICDRERHSGSRKPVIRATAGDIEDIARNSARDGPEIQWVESYVTDNRVYCVYMAPDEEAVRKHAEQSGFPANRISQVRAVIDPTTAD